MSEVFYTASAHDQPYFALLERSLIDHYGIIVGLRQHIEDMKGPSVHILRRGLRVEGQGVLGVMVTRMDSTPDECSSPRKMKDAIVLWTFCSAKDRRRGMGLRLILDTLQILHGEGIGVLTAYVGPHATKHRSDYLAAKFRVDSDGYAKFLFKDSLLSVVSSQTLSSLGDSSQGESPSSRGIPESVEDPPEEAIVYRSRQPAAKKAKRGDSTVPFYIKVQPPAKGLVGQALSPPVQVSGPEGCVVTAMAPWGVCGSSSATVTNGVAVFDRLAVNAPGMVRLTFTACGQAIDTNEVSFVNPPFPTVQTIRCNPYRLRPYHDETDRRSFRALVCASLDFTEAAKEFIEEGCLKPNVKRFVIVHPCHRHSLVGVLAVEDGWLTFVGIARTHRKQGLGAFLLAVALEVSRREGAQCLRLRPLNMKLVKFYEKYGFLSYKDPDSENRKKGQRKVASAPPMARWLQRDEMYLDRSLEDLLVDGNL